MKKALSILHTLALLLCCATALAETAPTDKDFVIVLTGNPTTGYEWKYVVGDESIVALSEDYLTSEDVDKLAGIESAGELPACGEGGLYAYTLKGLTPGETVIAFEYSQSWDEDSTVVGLTYVVRVNEDLSVVCTASTLGL